jgi:hypothetical protein
MNLRLPDLIQKSNNVLDKLDVANKEMLQLKADQKDIESRVTKLN